VLRVRAAVSRPELFSALVLLDPVIAPPAIKPGMTWADSWCNVEPLTALLDGAVARRNGWKSKCVICCLTRANPNVQFCSREAALESFKKNPFFATWDPLSLELYVECQLWENEETGEAKLKMSGTWVGGCTPLLLSQNADRTSQEGSVFAVHRGPYEAWDALPLLDERVTLKFIMPEARLLK